MPAHEHLSPDQLRKIAQRVHQESFSKHRLDRPEAAEGLCDTCTNTFLRDSGIPSARGQWYHGNDDEGFYISHKVAHVPTTRGTHVVDMTYNQFINHPSISNAESKPVPVPLVEHIDVFRKRPVMAKMQEDNDMGSDDYPEWLENNPHSTVSAKPPKLK